MHADAPGILQPPLGGWHDSETIISSDREGFIVVHGRVGRLARIGDEMASLDAIEAVVREVWPDGSHLVVSVPDRNMGERVVLVTTFTGAQRNALKQQARKKGATELKLPTEIVTVAEIPVLAGGGPDYGRARQIAMESLRLAKAA